MKRVIKQLLTDRIIDAIAIAGTPSEAIPAVSGTGRHGARWFRLAGGDAPNRSHISRTLHANVHRQQL